MTRTEYLTHMIVVLIFSGCAKKAVCELTDYQNATTMKSSVLQESSNSLQSDLETSQIVKIEEIVRREDLCVTSNWMNMANTSSLSNPSILGKWLLHTYLVTELKSCLMWFGINHVIKEVHYLRLNE